MHQNKHNLLPTPMNIRLDKWLWAARFFKTRSLAKTAIETGKILQKGQRCKSSRLALIGEEYQINFGAYEKTILIKGLNAFRRPAKEAVLLYEETHESIVKREALQAQKHYQTTTAPKYKPEKHDRKAIRQMKHTPPI